MAANPAVPTPELSFQTEKNGTETTLRFSGKITSNTSGSLRTAVKDHIPDTKTLVLDLTNVTYVDSSGVGALVGAYVSTKSAGCKLRLINLSQRLKELFSITRLAPLFEGHEDMLGLTPD
jgi:anti-sigma B factor antagonist